MAEKQKKQQPITAPAAEKDRCVELRSGDTEHHVTDEWFLEPDDPEYFLAMDHWACEVNQLVRVDLTRDEYIALKECLGKLRGFNVKPEAEQVEPTARDKTRFSVVLISPGAQKIEVIKVVRAVTGLDLKAAKDLVDGVPKAVKEGATKYEAKAIRDKFMELGAAVDVKPAA